MPDRPATLRDVAAAARVHPATASRALNPETRILVSEDTARRVTEAAARLGYRPNPVELAGAALTISALVANNLLARRPRRIVDKVEETDELLEAA